MIILIALILLGAAFGLLRLLFKLLKTPMKLGFKLLLHAVSGFIFLFLFNFLGSWVGLGLELNWINAIVTGVFGIPGVAVLLLLGYIM